jgi:hypothetical protein
MFELNLGASTDTFSQVMPQAGARPGELDAEV